MSSPSEEHKISPQEFDEFVAASVKAFTDCVVALDVLRESLAAAALTFGSFQKFYCRKCEKVFSRGQLKEITSLSVPCPECGQVKAVLGRKCSNSKCWRIFKMPPASVQLYYCPHCRHKYDLRVGGGAVPPPPRE